ncbi:fumarylacetoacetate hydrolase family protein [Streptomyces sp. NBC_01478]|uniref:fumarylacetoacetate hydrolase family protein n=1 Tax=Streptomyces sp. NBC_01478 TaxID=2903882 RepID=UPI002E342D64|nr:fumarylacetoacetate hydrolase family protein [Streptomyces sp. NBC_01478]
MRIANLNGRLVLLTAQGALDVEQASAGAFAADPQAVYENWTAFTHWAAQADDLAGIPYDERDLGAPAPRPRQVLAVGLNYRAHAGENDVVVPDAPAVFTKFPSSVTGPCTQDRLPEGHVDWEAELVVVIGRRAWQVAEADAWSHVAGLTVGQDLSERLAQFAGPAPQWGPAKSHPGFSPTGPCLVTPDEFANPDDLEIGCSLGDDVLQKDRTASMVFSVPAFIAAMSHNLPLLPGDILFTGTPAGVGLARTPPRFLAPGDELTTWIEGIGTIRQTFAA